MEDKNFDKIMKFIFKSEGGFVDDPDDLGGRTNLGVTQNTYNSWRKQKGLYPQDVKYITKEEARQLYYDEFWKPSGADKIEDLREAYLLFDMALNSGPYEAKKLFKQSGGNIYNFLKNRKLYYNNLVKKKPKQAKFQEGWLNRLKDIENNINLMVKEGLYVPPYAKEVTPFDKEYNGELKPVDKTMTSTEKFSKKNKYQYLLNKQQIQTGGASGIKNEEYSEKSNSKKNTTRKAKTEKKETSRKKSGSGNGNEKGHWITTKKGQHIFIEDGVPRIRYFCYGEPMPILNTEAKEQQSPPVVAKACREAEIIYSFAPVGYESEKDPAFEEYLKGERDNRAKAYYSGPYDAAFEAYLRGE